AFRGGGGGFRCCCEGRGAGAALGAGCDATGAIDAAEAAEVALAGGGCRCEGVAWCRALVIAGGAWTTTRLGPGPSGTPRGRAGTESRRGINAAPATATASRSAAIARSSPFIVSLPLPDPASSCLFPLPQFGVRNL